MPLGAIEVLSWLGLAYRLYHQDLWSSFQDFDMQAKWKAMFEVKANIDHHQVSWSVISNVYFIVLTVQTESVYGENSKTLFHNISWVASCIFH